MKTVFSLFTWSAIVSYENHFRIVVLNHVRNSGPDSARGQGQSQKKPRGVSLNRKTSGSRRQKLNITR